jgi:hypothetical protein
VLSEPFGDTPSEREDVLAWQRTYRDLNSSARTASQLDIIYRLWDMMLVGPPEGTAKVSMDLESSA